MSYKEKVDKLSKEYGISNTEYLQMVKNEIIIDGLILWAVIIILLIATLSMFIYAHQCNKKGKEYAFDFIIPITMFLLLFDVGIFLFTNFYSTPLNWTFNTDYIVIQRINEFDI